MNNFEINIAKQGFNWCNICGADDNTCVRLRPNTIEDSVWICKTCLLENKKELHKSVNGLRLNPENVPSRVWKKATMLLLSC